MRARLMRLLPLLWSAGFVAPLTAQAPPAAPTFAEHVAPIVYGKCAPCHRPGEATPFTLMSYEDVRRRGKFIAEVTQERYMPPWHAHSEVAGFRDDRRITDRDVQVLAAWAAAGMPRGNPAREPAVPKFTQGWQLGEPDLVVRMGEAMIVPEEGPDMFRNFAIDLGLKEDRWVQAIEFRPSGKASHHALFFFDTTGGSLQQDQLDPAPGFNGMGFVGRQLGGGQSGGQSGGQGGGARRGGVTELLRALAGTGADGSLPIGVLGGWAVGGSPAALPEGSARRLPAGSALVLQMHFHPSGKPETEQAVIGIHFASSAPKRTLIELQLPALFGALAGIDLTAGAPRTVIRDSFTLPVDVDVLGGGGHAHYLASDMKMTVTPPGGTPRELLSIPRWDFSWQEQYYFDKPVRLVAGTRVEVEIAYDNSAANPANPSSPPRRVRFGQQSTDEMGSITLEMLPVNEADLPRHTAAVREHLRSAAVARFTNPGAAGQAPQRQAPAQ